MSIEKYWYDLLYIIDHSEPQHWVMVLAGVIVVGYACMKSIGARSHY